MVGRRMFHFSFRRAVELFSYFFAPKLVNIFKIKFLDAVSATFLQKVFMDTINYRAELDVKRNDFVDILLNVKKNSTDDFKFGK